VDDPLQLKNKTAGKPKLFIGSYVRVEIEGQELDSVISLDRSVLRDGDHVWIMDPDNRLEIRQVEVAFRSRDQVLITGGVQAGERLVVSSLAAPVQGMALRTRDAEGKKDNAGQAAPAKEGGQ
jgi:hypothetical protein